MFTSKILICYDVGLSTNFCKCKQVTYLGSLEVRNLVFASGERFSILVDTITGIPDFEITLYVLTQLRSRNLSTSTIIAASRAIMFGFQLLAHMGVNLQERIDQGKLLEIGELDRLVDGFSWSHEYLRTRLTNLIPIETSNRVLNFESVRKSAFRSSEYARVHPDTAVTRLTYFRDFLKWKIERRLFALATNHQVYKVLHDTKELWLSAINARIQSATSLRPDHFAISISLNPPCMAKVFK